jgi:tetratricopeptide (TPR) repeat protein
VTESHDESLELYKNLATLNSTIFNSDVATTLDNLAYLYADSDRLDEAERAYDEALALYQKLIYVDSSRYGLDYANSIIFAFYCTNNPKYDLDRAEEILRLYIGVPRAEQLLEFIKDLNQS